MNSNVLVTVLCITYNHQNYIRRCLDSMICQKTNFAFEIIVHDDASTDGTQDIILEYAGRYPGLIIPVLQKENQYSKGYNFVENFMLPKASGKYIVGCEGDDFWCDPEKLRLQVEALETYSECSVCVHATSTADKMGNLTEMHFPDVELAPGIILEEEFMRLSLMEGHWLFHLSSLMVSEKLFREYMKISHEGFPSEFFMVGDLPLFLFLAISSNVYYIDRVMSTYTVESGGFMSRCENEPDFALRVHQGYINGLTAFDEFSQYRYHEYINTSLVSRRFLIDFISHRFDRIVQTPEYRPLIRKRGFLRVMKLYLAGYAMLLLGSKKQ